MKWINKWSKHFVNVQIDIWKVFTTKTGHSIFINYLHKLKLTTLEKPDVFEHTSRQMSGKWTAVRL